MSLFFRRNLGDPGQPSIPGRMPWVKGSSVNADTALRHSAVWACLRLRADLISTMPLDTYRQTGAVASEVPKPPVLSSPAPGVDITEWLYSSQMDLDRYGNAFGIYTGFDGMGLPSRIELVPAQDVTVLATGGTVTGYRIANRRYEPSQVWHERQFTVPGLAVGLSPVAYAAFSVGSYLSAQQFALDWFSNGAAPSGTLRNTKKIVDQPTIRAAKEAFKEATANRDIFVTGADWEFSFLNVPASETAFMDQMKYGIADACRFFGVPGDMIDAETSTGSITYANVTQRNLQLLITNLGPVFTRRERALSNLLPRPRFVKFNTDALLRMDPKGTVETLAAEINARIRTPDEARALRNLPPLTEEDAAAFDRLFGRKDKPVTQQAGLTVAPQLVLEQPRAAVTKTVERDAEGAIVRIVES